MNEIMEIQEIKIDGITYAPKEDCFLCCNCDFRGKEIPGGCFISQYDKQTICGLFSHHALKVKEDSEN